MGIVLEPVALGGVFTEHKVPVVALSVAWSGNGATNLCCLLPHHLAVVGALSVDDAGPGSVHILDLRLPCVDSFLGGISSVLEARGPVPVDVLSVHVVLGVLHNAFSCHFASERGKVIIPGKVRHTSTSCCLPVGVLSIDKRVLGGLVQGHDAAASHGNSH